MPCTGSGRSKAIIGLADKAGPERLDAACRLAIEVGDPTYRTVKGILAAHTETSTATETGVAVAPAHLHGPDSLFGNEEAAG